MLYFSIILKLSTVIFQAWSLKDYTTTVLEKFTGDDSEICFVFDGPSFSDQNLLIASRLSYILGFEVHQYLNGISFCSKVVICSSSLNGSKIYNFIEKNINRTETKVLLFTEENFEGYMNLLFNISWERNLDIYIFENIQNKIEIMKSKEAKLDENVTIYSAMSNNCILSCYPTDYTCFSNFSFKSSLWNPEIMLEKLNRRFKVSASAHPPYFERDGDGYKGIDYELVKLMIPTLPVSYRIFPDKPQSDQRVNYKTLVEFLNTANDGDLSVGGLWLTNDFPSTHLYARQCNTFLVHRPSLLPDSTFVFQYFQLPLWISYLGILFLMTFLLKFSYKLYLVDYSFDYCLLLILHYVANLGIPRFPDRRQFYARYVLSVWIVFCLLMTTYFGVGLTVTLRFPRFSQNINNWHDMVDLEIKWIENSEFYRDLIYNWGSNDKYLKNLAHLFQYEEDVNEINRKLQENYAVRVQKLPGFYLTNTGWMNDYAKKNFKLLKDCFLVWYNAFLLKNPTPLLKYFNKKTLGLVEYGFVKYWYQHHTNKKKNRYMTTFFNEYSDEYIQFIKLDKLKSCFLLLFGGLVVSTVVFLLEKIKFSSEISSLN